MMFDVGPAFAFWSFAAVTAVVYSLFPRRKERSLEEIEANLRDTALGSE